MRLTESLHVSACFEKVSLTQEVCAVSKTSEGDLHESSEQKKKKKKEEELYPFIHRSEIHFPYNCGESFSVTFTLSCISTQTYADLNWKISTVDRFHLHLNQTGKIKSFISESKSVCLSVSTPRLSHHASFSPSAFLWLNGFGFLSHIQNGFEFGRHFRSLICSHGNKQYCC